MTHKRTAEILCESSVTAATNIANLAGLDSDGIVAIALQLKQQSEAIKGGDISLIESALWSSSVELDTLHNHLLNMALVCLNDSNIMQNKFEMVELLLNHSLKIQAEKRKTLTSLAQIKNPKRATFIKQQLNQLNQLIQQKDAANMDTRTKGKAEIVDSQLEAVGELHRSRDTTRKEKIGAECH